MAQNSGISLSSVNSPAGSLAGDALVIGVISTPDGPALFESPLDAEETKALSNSLEALGVSGKSDDLHRLPSPAGVQAPVLVLVGLGTVADDAPKSEALRRAAGSAIRQLSGLNTVVLALPASEAAQLAAVAEGAALGGYKYIARSSQEASKQPVNQVAIVSSINTRAAKTILNRAATVGKAVNATRTLVNEPPSHLYPETFVDAAKELAKGLPVKITVWDEKKLEKEGFGGILGVGKGSSRPPRLVKVEYAPTKAKKHIALVGKGITFDSGGISLKPADSMMTMKLDMAGAAAILNATLAIAELGLPVRVTAWLCLAENMPSGTATRPSDVITIFGGKTVEVLNTDAEGRLVMADGLAVASTEYPDALLDVATLTGAQMVALGTRVSGVMGDEQLRESIKDAAEHAGELFWPMPIPEELRPSLDSPVADVANIGERFGGMMTAAAFLEEFVGETKTGGKIPWAHLDIAGPAYNEKAPYGYTPKQGTGVAVRTLLSYAEGVAAGK